MVDEPIAHTDEPTDDGAGQVTHDGIDHSAPFGGRAPGKVAAREANTIIRYSMFSVFSLRDAAATAGEGRLALESAAQNLADELAALADSDDLVLRGVYDLAGMRADADIMFWWHAPTIEAAQKAYKMVRRSRLGHHLEPTWSVASVHRPAEFNKGHIPAFMSAETPRQYVCVYPFVRSYEWYLLPDQERRDILVEHGKAARGYPDVRANTVPAFALNDYEWILAFEADELYRISDLMRDLRATEARLHVREEIPFFTGPKADLVELVGTWV